MAPCASCGCEFDPDRYHPNQKYCGRQSCRRSRRRRRQREKLRVDADYRANQASAQTRWRQTHPDYWKTYRAGHPEYVERNRRQTAQRRESRIRERGGCVAKMDVAFSPQQAVLSGRYRLEPVDGAGVAKMDSAILVQLSVLPAVPVMG
jgi:hypothetical protein